MKGMGSFLISIAIAGIGAGLTVMALRQGGIHPGFIPAFLIWMGIYWGVNRFLSISNRGKIFVTLGLLVVPLGLFGAFSLTEPRNAEDCILKYQKTTKCDRAAIIVNMACRRKFNPVYIAAPPSMVGPSGFKINDPILTQPEKPVYSDDAVDCILKNIGDAQNNAAATAIAATCNRKK